MEAFKVSVLITFYNQENYVDKAIESVLKQKIEYPVQIIVGDDGSSDHTLDKLENWVKKYPDIFEIHIMKREKKTQVSGFRASRMRLELIKYVKGEYFIFLDGDDYFCDIEKLQKQVAILENEQNKDCIACAHNISALYPDGHEKYLSPPNIKEGKYDLKMYWAELYFHTDTLLMRSLIINQIPQKLVENNYNDNMITFLALQKGKIYYIPKVMAVYLQTGDGIWTSGKRSVNAIRNIFLYDLCRMINPTVNKETDIRFCQSWNIIRQFCGCTDEVEMRPFEEEAKNKGFYYSLLWLQYNRCTFKNKIKLHVRLFSIRLHAFFYRIKRKLQ